MKLMSTHVLIVASLMLSATFSYANSCNQSMAQLVTDLRAMGADVSEINASQVVADDLKTPLLQVIADFKAEAFLKDEMIEAGLENGSTQPQELNQQQKDLNDFVFSQHFELKNAFDRHQSRCGTLKPEVKKLLQKNVLEVESVMQMLADREISRQVALNEINYVASNGSEIALLKAEAEKARQSAYDACKETYQESQCKKKYGY
ncbi:MAG: hypothetical protein KDD50_08810 [Bdellovibrionales bacterium]|nr:hypothetical protein [Bdellovibrionales bacterium]